MSQVYREHVIERTDDDVVAAEPAVVVHRRNVAEQLIYLIGGIIIALLGLRFILALLGANAANPFAHFIYTASHPFVAPFFGLFNYREQFGVSRFEFETLVAMVVYAIIMSVLAHLVNLGRRDTIVR